MRRRHQPAGETVPNLAPMVDVIMVLLVFFLLGTSLELARQGILKTELDPQSGPGAGARVEVNPLIRIGLENVGDGEAVVIHALDEALGENDFAALLGLLTTKRAAGADTENPVVIGAEGTVRWRFVIAAMDAAVRAGFKNVQFAVSFAPGSLSGGIPGD